MKEIAVLARSGVLIPIDDVSEETLRALEGREMMAKVWVPRNMKHNAWAHKLFAMVAENHPGYPTIRAVKNEIKFRIGHVNPRIVTVRVSRDVKADEQATGLIFEPRSTDFHSMDEDEFRDFMRRAIRVVCEDLLPGIENEDVAMEILRYAA